jgi:heptosyltransferase-1
MQSNLKILIVRLSSLGDIIHTYPMLYDIKYNLPDATIDWLVDESFTDLLNLNPLVDNIISIPLRKWKKDKLNLFSNFKLWRKQTKNLSYDYIIDAQGLLKSAILAKCLNGTIYGLGKNSIREKLACLFYTKQFETGKNLLSITKNRVLASMIFGYSIDKDNVNFGLTSSNFPPSDLAISKQYVIFFHATSKDSKKYPKQNWAELAKYLIREHNLSILLPFGSPREQIESLTIKRLINSDNVYVPNKILDYAKLSGLISNAQFVFGVDTGLIHLANALNKKIIAIYVDTNPDKTGIFESLIAKNMGNKNLTPSVKELMELFESIMRI